MKLTRKKTAAVVLSAALAACTAMGVSGCDATINSEIDATAGSEVISIAKSELRPVAEFICEQMGWNESLTDFVLNQTVATLVKNGASYSEQTGLITFTETAAAMKDELLKDSYVIYLSDLTSQLLGKFESSNVAATIDRDTLRAKFGELKAAITVNFDFKNADVVETNIPQDANGNYAITLSPTVSQLLDLEEGKLSASELFGVDSAIYAFFTDAYKTTSSIALSAKTYTQEQLATIATPGLISSVTVNGKAVPTASVVDLGSNGKKTVVVELGNGNSKTFTTTFDNVKPTANVKSSKTYKKGYVLKVADKTSGVKSIKLNGKAVKVAKGTTKKALTKVGSNKLTVTDKAGNVLKVSFKVK